MSAKITVVEINEGTKIAWKQSTTKLTFGDDELMVNCAAYQRDWPVHLDICGDKDGNLVIGTGTGRYYVAQVDIPAREYAEPEPVEAVALAEGDAGTDAQQSTEAEPVPLEMSDVTLTLLAVDVLRN